MLSILFIYNLWFLMSCCITFYLWSLKCDNLSTEIT